MTIGVRGTREIEALLKQLPERLAKSVVQGALRTGGTVIAKRAKANLDAVGAVDTGLLRKSIGVRAGKGSAQVGILSGSATLTRKGRKKAEKAVPTKYAKFTEFGSRKQPARPFLRPALDEGAIEAIRKIGEVMGRGVEREARALASGAKNARTGKRN